MGFARSALIGLLAGAFGGLVGLGGGAVMIPLMVRTAGLKQRESHGTSLVALVFTGLAGAVTYALRGKVDVMAALCLALTATLTAPVGARYAHALPEWKLKRSFGAFLVTVSLLLLAKPWLSSGGAAESGELTKAAILLATGVFTGFFSGMMGVGGGTIMVPSMVLLVGLPQVVAQGSSLLAMVPAGAVGAHTHWHLGNVTRRLLPGLTAGILVGAFAGGSLALRLPEAALQVTFGVVLGWTGIRYLVARRS